MTSDEEESGSPLEVFPTCIVVEGIHLWLAWYSTDDMERFVTHNGRLLWASSKESLVAQLPIDARVVQPDPSGETNFDHVVASLTSGRTPDVEGVLSAWNILTDFHNSVNPVPTVTYPPGPLMDSYDRVFSLCDVGEIVGIEPQRLDDRDRAIIQEVLASGIRMIGENTFLKN